MKLDFLNGTVHLKIVAISELDINLRGETKGFPANGQLSVHLTNTHSLTSGLPMELYAESAFGLCPVVNISRGFDGRAIVIEIYRKGHLYPFLRLYTDTPAMDGVTSEEIREEARRMYDLSSQSKVQAPN